MMRRKSLSSELFFIDIMKSNNSLIFLKELGKGDNFYFCQNIILFYFFQVYFNKKGKPQVDFFLTIISVGGVRALSLLL